MSATFTKKDMCAGFHMSLSLHNRLFRSLVGWCWWVVLGHFHFFQVSMYLAQSTNWGHHIQIELEIRCWFLRGKPEHLKKTLSEQGQEPTTNSTHIHVRCWVQELNPGHIGGRRVLSPPSHPCSPTLFSLNFFGPLHLLEVVGHLG